MAMTAKQAIELTKKYGTDENSAGYDTWKNAACVLAQEVERLKNYVAECVRAADEVAKANDRGAHEIAEVLSYIDLMIGKNGSVALADDEQLIAHLKENGYSELRKVDGVGMCGIMRMIYTVGVVVGLNYIGPQGRFCFNSLLAARSFLENWDGKAFPVVGLDGCTAIKWDGNIF